VATEDGGLRRFPYLHFATHGMLDDKRTMRSARLLAQDYAAEPPAKGTDRNASAGGRLTAERMLKRWKLDAELVTLSACQTGLGKYSGGEGYLGFSQALFVAGARSLVVSLWEVDDAATALLMTRFYENLMGLPAGVPGGPVAAKPTKAEALAEAKQWLRSLSPAEVDVLRKDLPRHGTRGEIVKKGEASKAPRSYEHPFYWSGFILIGEPR
jgi:CHAT domain-containing protein